MRSPAHRRRCRPSGSNSLFVIFFKITCDRPPSRDDSQFLWFFECECMRHIDMYLVFRRPSRHNPDLIDLHTCHVHILEIVRFDRHMVSGQRFRAIVPPLRHTRVCSRFTLSKNRSNIVFLRHVCLLFFLAPKGHPR